MKTHFLPLLALVLLLTPLVAVHAASKDGGVGKGKTDGGTAGLTPIEQSGTEADLALTRQIRQSVVADDRLSMTAKNVKIITRDAQVTLKGEVQSQSERDLIFQLAEKVAGDGRVIDQLEVSAAKTGQPNM